MENKKLKDYLKPVPESGLNKAMLDALEELKKTYKGQKYDPCFDPYQSPYI